MNPLRFLLALLVLWSCFSDSGLSAPSSEVLPPAAHGPSDSPPLDPRYSRPNAVDELLGDPDLINAFRRP